MNGPRRRHSVLLVPAVGLLALTGMFVSLPVARARENEAVNRFYEGTHIFRRILFELRLEPLGSFAELQEDPGDSLLVLLGKTDRLAELEGLKDFLARGGAVLLATDQAMAPAVAAEVKNVTGVRLTGQTLLYRRQPGDFTSKFAYRGLDYCPLPQRAPDGVPNLFRNPEPGGDDLEVATNVPSCLVPEGPPRPGMQELAILPTCIVDPPETVFPPRGGLPYQRSEVLSRPLLAVGGRVGGAGGRVLVLADHSIFINEMMLPANLGNVEFTYNGLGWLQDTGRTGARGRVLKRHKVLFLEEGMIQTDFSLPLKEVPELPLEALPALLAKLQTTMTDIEDDDGLSERFLGWLEDQRPGAVRFLARWGVYALGLIAFLYLAYRLGMRGRPLQDRKASLLAEAVARQQNQVVAPLLKQRQEAQLAAGNLWEAARELARQALSAVPDPLHVQVKGSWWRRWAMQRRMARLRRLAHGPRPVPVPPAAFRRLLRDVAALKAAVADGTIRFVPA